MLFLRLHYLHTNSNDMNPSTWFIAGFFEECLTSQLPEISS